MGLFRRRNPAPAPLPGAVLSAQALQHPQLQPGLTAGWAPMPGHQNPSQQIGLYDGRMLTQYPANLPGLQLLNGRIGNNPHWYTPQVQPTALAGVQQTTRGTGFAGAQRYGSIFGGPIGPTNVRQMQARLTAAQVRQSGLAMMQWARGLNE